MLYNKKGTYSNNVIGLLNHRDTKQCLETMIKGADSKNAANALGQQVTIWFITRGRAGSKPVCILKNAPCVFIEE